MAATSRAIVDRERRDGRHDRCGLSQWLRRAVQSSTPKDTCTWNPCWEVSMAATSRASVDARGTDETLAHSCVSMAATSRAIVDAVTPLLSPSFVGCLNGCDEPCNRRPAGGRCERTRVDPRLNGCDEPCNRRPPQPVALPNGIITCLNGCDEPCNRRRLVDDRPLVPALVVSQWLRRAVQSSTPRAEGDDAACVPGLNGCDEPCNR